MIKMLAFHGSAAIKRKYMLRLKAHHKADEIIHGTGYENGRGCAVGCTLDKYDHKSYETELGIPERLARLEDVIFEGLPEKDAPKFAVNFLMAICPGVDLSLVPWQFHTFILRENIERMLTLKCISGELREQVVNAVRDVLMLQMLQEKAAKIGELPILAIMAVESAARTAAKEWSAARSAATESAARAAWSAARAAATESLAAAVELSAAARMAAAPVESAAAARSAAYKRYAAELLRLLKAAK